MMAKKKKDASESQEEKVDQKELKKEIKEMERKKREAAHKAAAVAPAPANRDISYDEWYMMRSAAIPKVHRKEVLRADFKARGLGKKADLASYDEALEKYGVKLRK